MKEPNNKYLSQETYSDSILLNVIVNEYSVIITHLSDKRVGQNYFLIVFWWVLTKHIICMLFGEKTFLFIIIKKLLLSLTQEFRMLNFDLIRWEKKLWWLKMTTIFYRYRHLYHTLYSLHTIILMSLLIIIVPPQNVCLKTKVNF